MYFFPHEKGKELQQLFIWGRMLPRIVKVLIFGVSDWTRGVVLDPIVKISSSYDCWQSCTFFFAIQQKINAPELLLRDYPNIKTYKIPTNHSNWRRSDVMMLPWICSENYDETLKQIKKSKAKISPYRGI
jgi:hypothetical protein